MPPEWNTRSMVEVPVLLVSGLPHELARPTGRPDRIQPPRSRKSYSHQKSRDPGQSFREWDDSWACAAAGQKNVYRERRRQAVW